MQFTKIFLKNLLILTLQLGFVCYTAKNERRGGLGSQYSFAQAHRLHALFGRIRHLIDREPTLAANKH